MTGPSSGIISAFAFSLLTRRAFFLRPLGTMDLRDGRVKAPIGALTFCSTCCYAHATLTWLCCMCRMGMPNIDWSDISTNNMSTLDVVDFKTAGAVRLRVW